MRIQIDQNTTQIHNVKNEVALKAGESNLGRYLERIASGVHKDVGNPEHIFKLNEPGFLESNFKTPDGDKLKKGVEKVIAKMEVISNFAKQQKKFKTLANNRIHALEEEQKQNVQKLQFSDEMKNMEQRILGYLRENIDSFQLQMDQHGKDISEAKVMFGRKVDNYQSEVLWRIQHCEEMVK